VLSRASDVAAAGTALAGLILVYLGAVAVRYESLNTKSKANQRDRYRWHAWLALNGIVFALAATVLALIAGSFASHQELAELLARLAAVALLVSFIWHSRLGSVFDFRKYRLRVEESSGWSSCAAP